MVNSLIVTMANPIFPNQAALEGFLQARRESVRAAWGKCFPHIQGQMFSQERN